MDIEVLFWVKGIRSNYLYEEEALSSLIEINEMGFLSGFLTITGNNVRVEMSDDLDYMIPKCCFASIPVLCRKECFSIVKASSSGSYNFYTEEEIIWISGNNIKPSAFPKSGLLNALFLCGLRFLEFLRKLDEYSDNYSGVITEMERGLHDAQVFIENLNA